MISWSQDSDWPDRVCMDFRGWPMWMTLEELQQIHNNSGYILANPIKPPSKAIKMYQLMEATR